MPLLSLYLPVHLWLSQNKKLKGNVVCCGFYKIQIQLFVDMRIKDMINESNNNSYNCLLITSSCFMSIVNVYVSTFYIIQVYSTSKNSWIRSTRVELENSVFNKVFAVLWIGGYLFWNHHQSCMKWADLLKKEEDQSLEAPLWFFSFLNQQSFNLVLKNRDQKLGCSRQGFSRAWPWRKMRKHRSYLLDGMCLLIGFSNTVCLHKNCGWGPGIPSAFKRILWAYWWMS